MSATDRGDGLAERDIIWVDQAEVAETEVGDSARGRADVQRIACGDENDCE
jgi:hypothetical protein